MNPTFEAAADSIVNGNVASLIEALDHHPQLVNARSERDHHATLLHYVAANGVEDFRQRTPANILEITQLLLDRGANVDAEADVYGGGATTLGLAATSAHPRNAGVQNALIDLLIERGAELDRMGHACLANGCPEAAAHLASLGRRSISRAPPASKVKPNARDNPSREGRESGEKDRGAEQGEWNNSREWGVGERGAEQGK
jgi:hypothetical protein